MYYYYLSMRGEGDKYVKKINFFGIEATMGEIVGGNLCGYMG